MQKAWYVVEVYSLLTIVSLLLNFRSSIGDPTGLAILIGETAFVLLLSWFTLCGKRLASRILALYIALGAVFYTWTHVVEDHHKLDVYLTCLLAGQAYLFIAAIKLWRIKELPTRFTDPPAEPKAHA